MLGTPRNYSQLSAKSNRTRSGTTKTIQLSSKGPKTRPTVNRIKSSGKRQAGHLVDGQVGIRTQSPMEATYGVPMRPVSAFDERNVKPMNEQSSTSYFLVDAEGSIEDHRKQVLYVAGGPRDLTVRNRYE